MEGATDDCLYIALNWTIDNFSCWNGDIHGPAMTLEASLFSREGPLTFELYPRGLGGSGEQLVTRLCVLAEHSSLKELLGDLSFIGSDGSLLCTLEIDGEMKEGVLELTPGPMFRDVIEHIRNNETLHEDRLTLRFRFIIPPEEASETYGYTYDTNSMVDAFETSVKVHLALLKENELFKENGTVCIMEYPLNNGRMESTCLAIKDWGDTMLIGLAVLEEAVESAFAVRTRMSLLSGDGSVLRVSSTMPSFTIRTDLSNRRRTRKHPISLLEKSFWS